MTFVRQGVVLSVGESGDFDDRSAFFCGALLLDDKVYLYYTSYDGIEYAYDIGLAISDDGIHFVKQGVVLPCGASGNFDGGSSCDPAPLLRDGKVYLYYTGSMNRIGLAISEDGVRFVRHGVVLPLGAPGDFDDNYIFHSAPLEKDGRVWIYYIGIDGSKGRTGLATSEDGMRFNRHGVVLPLGAAGDFDDSSVSRPAVLEKDGKVWLYYTGISGGISRIGLAISSDGVNFVRQGVVLPLGGGGDFDGKNVYHPAVLERGGQVWMYYTGNIGTNYRIGLAISEDGL